MQYWKLRLIISNAQEGMSPSKVSFNGKKIYKEGVLRVRMLTILTMSYFLFWCPIFLVTLLSWSWTYEKGSKSITHEVKYYKHTVTYTEIWSGQVPGPSNISPNLIFYILCFLTQLTSDPIHRLVCTSATAMQSYCHFSSCGSTQHWGSHTRNGGRGKERMKFYIHHNLLQECEKALVL